MQVNGTKVERSVITVDVNPIEVIDKLQRAWTRSLPDVSDADYINQSGVWESWYDTGHGSGSISRYRQATDEEIQIDGAFKLIRDVAHEQQ